MYNRFRVMAAWSRKSSKKVSTFDIVYLRGNFQNSVPKGSPPRQSTRCKSYANFVKFGRREIGEFVRCLPDKTKTKIRLALPHSLLRGFHSKCARTSARQCTPSAPDFIQIDSLSAEL